MVEGSADNGGVEDQLRRELAATKAENQALWAYINDFKTRLSMVRNLWDGSALSALLDAGAVRVHEGVPADVG